MTYLTVFNDSDSPVVVSDDGRVVGGGDWGTALSTDESVKVAIAAGQLVEIEAPEGDTSGMNPAAVTALEQTARFTDRREQVKEWDKAQLQQFAADSGLVVADDAGVADMRRLVAESSVKLPEPATKKATEKAPAPSKQDDKPSK